MRDNYVFTARRVLCRKFFNAAKLFLCDAHASASTIPRLRFAHLALASAANLR